MKKSSHRVHRSKKIRHSPPGTAPGAIVIPSDALQLKIKSFCYNQNDCSERDLTGVSDIKNQLASFPSNFHWFDIKGFGDKLFLEQLADCFGIHRLQMEDVVNVYQRPKAEEFKGHLFFISRMVTERHGVLINDQLSLFLGSNYVITIQDKYEDCLEPVRETGSGTDQATGGTTAVRRSVDVCYRAAGRCAR